MPKLLLIQSGGLNRKGLADTQSRYPSLGLGCVAAITPNHWDIEIADGMTGNLLNREADLVGISAFTSTINEAYQIAKHYRSRGIKVVIGGIHATLLPDEVANFCDSVFIGEAEGLWAQVIHNFEKGKLMPVYRSEHVPASRIASPNRSLFHPGYKLSTLQASKGCPYNCDYCSVSVSDGKTFRKRPVSDIIDDWLANPAEFVFFADDNLFGFNRQDKAWVMELFRGLASCKPAKHWMCFAHVNSLLDETLVREAALAGCRMIYIGFEADCPTALSSVNKSPGQLSKYEDVIRMLHKYGITVQAGIMLAFETDTPESIRRRIDFVLNSEIDSWFVSVLTPLPGTRLFDRLQKEGRLLYNNFPDDWHHFDWCKLTYQPLAMSVGKAEQCIAEAYERVYAEEVIRAKFAQTRKLTQCSDTAMFNYLSNMNFREIFLNQR